jgi:hypothetical protein
VIKGVSCRQIDHRLWIGIDRVHYTTPALESIERERHRDAAVLTTWIDDRARMQFCT